MNTRQGPQLMDDIIRRMRIRESTEKALSGRSDDYLQGIIDMQESVHRPELYRIAYRTLKKREMISLSEEELSTVMGPYQGLDKFIGYVAKLFGSWTKKRADYEIAKEMLESHLEGDR